MKEAADPGSRAVTLSARVDEKQWEDTEEFWILVSTAVRPACRKTLDAFHREASILPDVNGKY